MTAIQFKPNKHVALHLPYLDSIRGLAALYVAIGHIWQFLVVQPPYATLPSILAMFKLGHFAVAIFIVLSGYCLMLPIAVKGHVEQENTWLGSFLRRRLFRIYPAYLVTILISLSLIAITGIGTDPTRLWTKGVNHFSTESIGTHLLLMHNLTHWDWSINPPMWSVALEWQIYMVFGAVLIPLWKRLHPFTILGGIIAVTSLTAFSPIMQGKSLWFIGLFFMGCLSACYGTRTSAGVEGLGLPGQLWKIAGLPIGIPAILIFAITSSKLDLNVLNDFILGIGICGILVWLQRTWSTNPKHFVIRALSVKPLSMIGGMSYSIYLLHFPILEVTNAWLVPAFSPLKVMAIQTGLVLPIILGLSWLMYKFIELPCIKLGKMQQSTKSPQPSSNVVTP